MFTRYFFEKSSGEREREILCLREILILWTLRISEYWTHHWFITYIHNESERDVFHYYTYFYNITRYFFEKSSGEREREILILWKETFNDERMNIEHNICLNIHREWERRNSLFHYYTYITRYFFNNPRRSVRAWAWDSSWKETLNIERTIGFLICVFERCGDRHDELFF